MILTACASGDDPGFKIGEIDLSEKSLDITCGGQELEFPFLPDVLLNDGWTLSDELTYQSSYDKEHDIAGESVYLNDKYPGSYCSVSAYNKQGSSFHPGSQYVLNDAGIYYIQIYADKGGPAPDFAINGMNVFSSDVNDIYSLLQNTDVSGSVISSSDEVTTYNFFYGLDSGSVEMSISDGENSTGLAVYIRTNDQDE